LQEAVREEDKTQREKLIAKTASTPEMAQLAAETRFSSEYLAQLQVMMKAKTKMLNKKMGQVALQQQDGKEANSTQNFLQYIEEASTFREAAPLKDRVSYIFHMFDEDKDGKLGRSDLRKVIGVDCTEEVLDSVLEDMGGPKARFVTLNNLVSYAERTPGVAEALSLRAKNNGGLATQLAERPLVLLALKRGANLDDHDDANDDFTGFVKTLAAFGPGRNLRTKIDLVWDALDEDRNGFLSENEVGRIAKECVGDQAEAMIIQLQTLRSSIQDVSGFSHAGIPKEDFIRFAMTKLPGVESALTVVAELTAGEV